MSQEDSFSATSGMANTPTSDENVLPFRAMRIDDIPDFDATDLVTAIAMFYPANERGEPDMRISLGNASVVKLVQILDLAMRTRLKPVESIVVAPTSMLMLFRIGVDMWCMIVFIFTPAPLAINASASLGALLTERQRPTTFRLPSFLQSPNNLYDIRTAINAVRTATPPSAEHVFLAPPIAPYTNIAPSAMMMIPAAGASNLTRARAVMLCGDDTPLCLFTALGIPELVGTLRAIQDPKYTDAIDDFIGWTERRGHFPHEQHVFAMTIPDIIVLLQGQSSAPICVSDSYISAAMAMAGGILPTPYARADIIRDMMYQTGRPYRRDGGIITCRFMPPVPRSIESCSMFPLWMNRMEFMVRFKTDVMADWASFGASFEAVYRRVMMRTLETPGWIVAAFAGLVTRPRIPHTTANPCDLMARSSNHWWAIYGDVTGTFYCCFFLYIIEYLLQTSFLYRVCPNRRFFCVHVTYLALVCVQALARLS